MASVLITLTATLQLLASAHGNLLDKYVTDIFDSIDRDADPCEDFHQFACGNWVKRYCSTTQSQHISQKLHADLHTTFTTSLESLKTHSNLTEVEKLVKDNYEFCMKSTFVEDKLDFDDEYNSTMNRVKISTVNGESDTLHIIRLGAAIMREYGFIQNYVGIHVDFGKPNGKGYMELMVNYSQLLCHTCENDTAKSFHETADVSASLAAVATYTEELLQIENEEISKLLDNYELKFIEIDKSNLKPIDRTKLKEIMIRKAIENWREYVKTDRSKICMNFIGKHSIGAFVRAYVKRELKREVAELKAEIDLFINVIFGAFPPLISTNRWMTRTEIVNLIKHVDDMRHQLTLPDWCLSEETILANSGRFIANMSLLENDRRECQRLKDDPIKKLACLSSELSETDLVFNAYYDIFSNRIVLLLAPLLEPSFVAGSQLQPVRFGRFGHLISHELMHGVYLFINNKTNELDGFYNTSNEKVLACVIDIYKTALSHRNMTDDSSATVFEDIPDIEGLKLAYLAYTFQKLVAQQSVKPTEFANISDEQLFFISYANNWCDCKTAKKTGDSHSPNRIRAEIPVWEMSQFGEAFQCKPDSKYNIQKKCEIYSKQ